MVSLKRRFRAALRLGFRQFFDWFLTKKSDQTHTQKPIFDRFFREKFFDEKSMCTNGKMLNFWWFFNAKSPTFFQEGCDGRAKFLQNFDNFQKCRKSKITKNTSLTRPTCAQISHTLFFTQIPRKVQKKWKNRVQKIGSAVSLFLYRPPGGGGGMVF